MLETIGTFSRNLLDEVLTQATERNDSLENVFTQAFSEYLVDAGECFDVTNCFYKKTTKGIKVNAYSYSDDFDEFSLFISNFDSTTWNRRLRTNKVLRQFKRINKFYLAAIGDLKHDLEESSDCFSFVDLLLSNKNKIRKVKMYLLTNAIADNDVPATEILNGVSISYHIWDIERVHQVIFDKTSLDTLVIPFDDYTQKVRLISTPDSNSTYDSYVGVIPGKLLAEIYNEYGQRLIERNVRSFLQAKGKINKGIKSTIKDEPQMFMAYNNGISTIAEGAVFNSDTQGLIIQELTGWQIVNGGQTTSSLYHGLKDKMSLEEIFVPIKLVVIKNVEKINDIVSKISRYANSQNKISISDFTANDPFHVEIEKMSRRVWAPGDIRTKSTSKWFYERARGQYFVEFNRQGTATRKNAFQLQNPKNQIITKTLLAKYQMSWLQFPHIVSRGSETNFVFFTELIGGLYESLPDEKYYRNAVASGILFNACDLIVKNHNFGGYKANVVTYTISLLSLLDKLNVNLEEIWKLQKITPNLEERLNNLSKFVWNHITNPPVKGTNITQWCKREECWENLKANAEGLNTKHIVAIQ